MPATAVLLALAAAATSAAPATQCAAIDKAGVIAFFDGWNVALATLDADAVTRRYWDDAVLLPTVSNTPRTNPAMIRDYFEHFLQNRPRGRIDSRTVQVGCNLAIDMGTYTFSLMGNDGKVREVAARYSYIYQYRSGSWKILHHHSSAMPEKSAAPTQHAETGGDAHDEAAQEKAAKPEAKPKDKVAAHEASDAADARDAAEQTAVARTSVFLNKSASPDPDEFYPAKRGSHGAKERVAMQVCADPRGELVGQPRVVATSGSTQIDEAAAKWARAAKWVPATYGGSPVEGCAKVSVQFGS